MYSFFSERATESFVGKQVNITFILLYLQNRIEIKLRNTDSIIFHTSSQDNSEWSHRKNLNWEDRSYMKNL